MDGLPPPSGTTAPRGGRSRAEAAPEGRASRWSAVSGFRGAVSLAAALAVPETTTSGAPFPSRDQIVLITSGVVPLRRAEAGYAAWVRGTTTPIG